jgi:B-cell receptor-associated protein 31
VYLTGSTLFLSLMLARVFYIVLDFIHVQESYSALQAKTAKQSGATGEGNELRQRIKELETELQTNQTSKQDFGG